MTETILLSLLGRELWGYQFSLDDLDVDWNALYNESCQQAVSALVYDSLTESERSLIPPALQQRWKFSTYNTIRRHEELMAEQKRLIDILESHRIPCVILKGWSAAMYYPNPSLRAMGDIDILVDAERREEAKLLLQEYGYMKCQGDTSDVHYEMKNLISGVAVELHKEPVGMQRAGAKKDVLYTFFENATARLQNDRGIPVLSDQHQAMVLVLHKLQHFLDGGLGLRQLCDWAVFVRVKPSDIWQELSATLSAVGLLHYGKVITRACIEGHLMPESCAPWAMDADQRLAKDVLQQILSDGNFGCKANNYGRAFFANYESSNRITSIFDVSAEICGEQWPVFRKYRVLVPLTPLIVFTRYLLRRLKGERPKFDAAKQFNSANARRQLYKSLKPFMVEADDADE